MKIYLVRHGQSEWQLSKDDEDWNSGLTAVGQRQAQLLGAWLADEGVLDAASQLRLQRLRVSPLLRAQQTAQPLSNALSLPFLTDVNLQEADFYVSAHLPSVTSPLRSAVDYQPSATYSRLKEQATLALQALVADAEEAGGAVMGIAHGGLISTLLRTAVGSDAISFWLYNTSLNLIEWKRGRWHLVFLNLWDHLPPELRTY